MIWGGQPLSGIKSVRKWGKWDLAKGKVELWYNGNRSSENHRKSSRAMLVLSGVVSHWGKETEPFYSCIPQVPLGSDAILAWGGYFLWPRAIAGQRLSYMVIATHIPSSWGNEHPFIAEDTYQRDDLWHLGRYWGFLSKALKFSYGLITSFWICIYIKGIKNRNREIHFRGLSSNQGKSNGGLDEYTSNRSGKKW